MKNWSYYIPTKIIFGINTFDDIKQTIDNFSPKNILLVTGRNSMQKLGITDKIKNLLKGYKIILFNEVEPNPSIQTVERGLKFCQDNKCDLIIGIGGGSALDVGKTIAILIKNKGDVKDYLYHKKTIKKKGLPFIAIPTTAGTASEISKYSIITDREKPTKRGLLHDFMHPDVAIIDPLLTESMPRDITASTGMDALAHAVESYWSINAQPITEMFALKSIELVYENLVAVCNNLHDINLRESMCKASLFAGFAFDYTGTNVLHSVSYPLTTKFNIPHGHACALTMVQFMKFNKDMIKEKMSKISKITGANSIDEGINNIQKMLENTGLPMRLSKLGISKNDIDIIIQDGFRPEKMETNPRTVTEDALRKILTNIL